MLKNASLYCGSEQIIQFSGSICQKLKNEEKENDIHLPSQWSLKAESYDNLSHLCHETFTCHFTPHFPFICKWRRHFHLIQVEAEGGGKEWKEAEFVLEKSE